MKYITKRQIFIPLVFIAAAMCCALVKYDGPWLGYLTVIGWLLAMGFMILLIDNPKEESTSPAYRPGQERRKRTRLYFESHVTIEPIFDEALAEASRIAQKHGFKIANLLMQKRKADTPTRSQYDTFMTGHGQDYIQMKNSIRDLVYELQANKFVVHRYKIEDTLMDSRTKDELLLLDF